MKSVLPAVLLATLAVTSQVSAQIFPDLLYYKFDEGTGLGGVTANLANPGVGGASSTVGPNLNLAAGGGQFNGCLTNAATAATSSDFVDTGWVTNLTGSWTIHFWADLTVATGTSLQYLAGDITAASFRIFYNGVAGTGVILRGGGTTDTLIPNAGVGGPHACTFVYDSVANEIRGYLDGVLAVTVPQGTPNVVGTGNFHVGHYSATSGISNGFVLDEFRLYGRALSAGEVAASWNVEVADNNVLAISNSGMGVGDLMVSLGQVSPTATEGWLLITMETSGNLGAGPLLGITPDALTWSTFLSSPLLDGYPLHFPVPSPSGAFPTVPFTLPAGSNLFPPGTVMDVVALLAGPGPTYDSRSVVVRYTFN